MPTVDKGYTDLFRVEYPRVLRAVSMMVRDRESAEDVTQDAFAELLRHWHRVRNYERPDAWVRTVAVRLAVRRDRRERLRGHVESSATPTEPPDGDRGVHIDIVAALSQLPVKQRAVIVLHYLEDLPVSEAAEIVGCRASTASVHLHRARLRLAELLGEEVGNDVHR